MTTTTPPTGAADQQPAVITQNEIAEAVWAGHWEMKMAAASYAILAEQQEWEGKDATELHAQAARLRRASKVLHLHWEHLYEEQYRDDQWADAHEPEQTSLHLAHSLLF